MFAQRKNANMESLLGLVIRYTLQVYLFDSFHYLPDHF